MWYVLYSPILFFLGYYFLIVLNVHKCVVACTLWLMMSLPFYTSKFGFAWCFILQGGHDNGNLGKGMIYHDWHSRNAFLPLAIMVFSCLHQHANDIFHQGANMMWSTKDTYGPPLVVLHVFYRQRVNSFVESSSDLYLELHHVALIGLLLWNMIFSYAS